MSHGTEGAVRAESSLFELCRIASEEDEVKSRKAQKYLVTQIAQITLILFIVPQKSQRAQILFCLCPAERKEIKERFILLMDTLMVVDVFLKINFHHTSLTSMAYSLYKMNKGLDFFEELMRASFQYSSNKIKHPSIRDNSFYSINSCSFLNFPRFLRFLRDNK